jgi:hypothetical protein
MFKPLIATLLTIAIIKVGLDVIAGSTFSVDLWLGRMSWLPITSLTELPDVCAPIVKLFPVLPFLSLMLLLAVGILALLEMD